MAVGAHVFLCQQESLFNDVRQASSGIVKGDLGFTMKLNEKDMLDATFTLARINYYSKIAQTNVANLDAAKYSVGINARAFLTVAQIGGQIVPSVQFNNVHIANDTILSVSPGVGYTREIEGGSFWAGLDYTYENARISDAGNTDTLISNTTQFSFGIEKQVAWPWFVLRVGGKKEISMDENRPGVAGQPVTVNSTSNPDNDRTVNDVIGAGVSMKVGEHLRFDVSANERIPFSNIFNGTLESLASRISATYSF
jgi:hypothetical protein